MSVKFTPIFTGGKSLSLKFSKSQVEWSKHNLLSLETERRLPSWLLFVRRLWRNLLGFGKKRSDNGKEKEDSMSWFNQNKADFEKAERLAWETLVECKVNRPPVIAVEIAKQKGRIVEVAHLKQKYRQDVAGFIDPDTGVIVVNGEDSVSRRNFTVAHELGHIVLGHDIASEYTVLFRDSEKKKNKSPTEQEADCFAANLLVPMSMLRECLERYPFATNRHLALFFGVSEEVIKWRRKRA